MILVIIFIVLVVLGILLVILGYTGWAYDNDFETGLWIIGGVSLIIGLLACLISSIICIVVHQPSNIAIETYQYQEQINFFENERTILESYHPINESGYNQMTSDITFEVISTSDYYNRVSDYNNKIYSFKVAIKKQQFNIQNPWINWFVSPACWSVNDETLNNLTYTIGR